MPFKELNLQKITDLRAKDSGGTIFIKGEIVRKSEIVQRITARHYRCNKCREGFVMPQGDIDKKEMKKCPECKSHVRQVSQDICDSQIIKLKDMREKGSDSIISVRIEQEFCNPKLKNIFTPGRKISVVGKAKNFTVENDFDDAPNISHMRIEANNLFFE